MNAKRNGAVIVIIAAHVFAIGWFYWIHYAITTAPKIESIANNGSQGGVWVVNLSDSSDNSTRLRFIDHRVAEMMNYIPWSSRDSILSVEFFDFYSCNTNLCHAHPDGRICLSAAAFKSHPDVFYHEFGHARHFRLNREKSNFEARWGNIQGGTLHADLHQDVAEHTMHAYQHLQGKSSVYDSFPHDPAYQQKLALLKEYGFIPKY